MLKVCVYSECRKRETGMNGCISIEALFYKCFVYADLLHIFASTISRLKRLWNIEARTKFSRNIEHYHFDV